MLKTVGPLSDGELVEVRVLGLYELDSVPMDDISDFEYDYQVSDNQVTKKAYNLHDWTEAPQKPDTPKELCEHGSFEWAMWNAYDLYQAVLQRRYEQIEAAERHAHDVARYIVQNCLAEADRSRVVTPGNLDVVWGAAMVDEETMEGLEAALASTFPGLLEWTLDFVVSPRAAGGRG